MAKNQPSEIEEPQDIEVLPNGLDAGEEPDVFQVVEPVASIRYNGVADRRVLTVSEISALGGSVLSPLVWSQENDFLVTQEGLSEEVVEAICNLPGFSRS